MKFNSVMTVTVEKIRHDELSRWDYYVNNHPESNLYHLSSWMEVITKTYGHETIYIAARRGAKICGILPIVRLNHFIFGDSLTSIPFFDSGGIIADTPEIENMLLRKIYHIGLSLKTDKIELRSFSRIKHFDSDLSLSKFYECKTSIQTSKVCMRLKLLSDSKKMMKSFKSKLRSQIRKPIKEGLKFQIGHTELLDDFYKVFLINMRDLGSPVHSKDFIANAVKAFPQSSRIVIVYKESEPVSGSIIIGFKHSLMNPWASSLRKYSRLSANMLLYWAMLEYACDNGYRYFDFGRSTPGEGTHRFKKQWGAKEFPLYWHQIVFKGEKNTTQNSKFDTAIQYWKKLPVCVTKFLGPPIRKNISL